jgi:hypothetical protein
VPQLRPPPSPAPAAAPLGRAPSEQATTASAPVAAHAVPLSNSQLLLQAVLRAADQLELSRSALALVLGRDRSLFSRGKGIEPASKTGELALLLVRLFRSLAVLVGNDPAQMRHWFHTANHHTGGVPAEQVQRTESLVEIVHYLNAMRARV